MLRKLIVLVSLAVLTQVETKTLCRHDDECGTGECCYYHEGPMVVSKRNVFLPNAMVQGGWCERYKLEGEHCNPFDALNGHCSCGPNLTCHRFEITTTLPVIVKRDLLAGDYRCAPKQ